MTQMKLNGGQKLLAKLRDIEAKAKKKQSVKVGFLSKATYPNGTKVAYVAAIQNYGAPAAGIPPRPFFTQMLNDRSSKWGDTMGKLIKKNNYNVKLTLEMMGIGIRDQLIQYIDNTRSPADSMVTNLLKRRFPMGDHAVSDVWQAFDDVYKKGMSAPATKPLVWTGLMRQSVDWEIKE